MSPERTSAYRRVMRILDDLGPTKLQPDEQERIRYAADTLIFSSDARGDEPARDALEDIAELCRMLVDSGRWEPATAERLQDDVRACGPEPVAGLRAA
jgi:hypothetical protein